MRRSAAPGKKHLKPPRRGRTTGGRHRVRGRGTDERIEKAPPRLVNIVESKMAAGSRARENMHPGPKRLKNRMVGKLRRLRKNTLMT